MSLQSNWMKYLPLSLSLNFQIPKFSPDWVIPRWYGNDLEIEGVVCGNKTGKRKIRARILKDNIFIQTDKPIYKPGQKSRIFIVFRSITLLDCRRSVLRRQCWNTNI